MRPFPTFLILVISSVFLVLSSETSDARWWKSQSEKKAEKVGNTEKSKTDSKVSVSDSDRFLSYDEQKEKELDEAREARKGVFLRFPWAKKNEKDEVADPFGNVKQDAPQYQNLEELGISAKNSQTAESETSLNTSRAGSALTGSATDSLSSNNAVNTVSVSEMKADPSWLQHAPDQAVSLALGNPSVSAVPTTQTADSSTVSPAVPSNTLPEELPTELPSEIPANTATGTGAVGTAVTLPSNAASTNVATHQLPPPVQAAAEVMQNDTILKQIPSLMVDTSKLAGEGIQYYEQGQVLAQVGSQVVLAGDIISVVDRVMEEHKDEIPENFRDMQREMLIRTFLNQSVESKLIYCDVLRNVPPEGIKQNFEMIDKLFEDEELPKRMKNAGVQLREDYEKKLQEEGSCILKQKYIYRELVFCQQWMMKTIPQNPTVSYLEISDYYHENLKQFQVPPKARWEELVIRKSRFYSRDEAYQEIVRIGSLVAVQQKPFAEVAKEFSHGVSASDGGVKDWVKPGQLASKPLEEAIFSQPVGALSEKIIEDEQCFYIVRVLEREEMVQKSLSEVQGVIQAFLVHQKVEKAREEYLAKLKREIPVFTVFDGIPSPEERLKAEQESAMAAQKQNQNRLW